MAGVIVKKHLRNSSLKKTIQNKLQNRLHFLVSVIRSTQRKQTLPTEIVAQTGIQQGVKPQNQGFCVSILVNNCVPGQKDRSREHQSHEGLRTQFLQANQKHPPGSLVRGSKLNICPHLPSPSPSTKVFILFYMHTPLSVPPPQQ